MNLQTKTDAREALQEIGRAVLVNGGYGLVLLLSSLGLLTISMSLAMAVVLWSSRTLLSAAVFVLILLSEIVIISLAVGALLFGLGLFLKGVTDALARSGQAVGPLWGPHKLGSLMEKVGLDLGQWVAGLLNRTTDVFKLALGDRRRQFLLLLLLVLMPPLLTISGWTIGAVIRPHGIAMIKCAVTLSINCFK